MAEQRNSEDYVYLDSLTLSLSVRLDLSSLEFGRSTSPQWATRATDMAIHGHRVHGDARTDAGANERTDAQSEAARGREGSDAAQLRQTVEKP